MTDIAKDIEKRTGGNRRRGGEPNRHKIRSALRPIRVRAAGDVIRRPTQGAVELGPKLLISPPTRLSPSQAPWANDATPDCSARVHALVVIVSERAHTSIRRLGWLELSSTGERGANPECCEPDGHGHVCVLCQLPSKARRWEFTLSARAQSARVSFSPPKRSKARTSSTRP